MFALFIENLNDIVFSGFYVVLFPEFISLKTSLVYFSAVLMLNSRLGK